MKDNTGYNFLNGIKYLVDKYHDEAFSVISWVFVTNSEDVMETFSPLHIRGIILSCHDFCGALASRKNILSYFLERISLFTHKSLGKCPDVTGDGVIYQPNHSMNTSYPMGNVYLSIRFINGFIVRVWKHSLRLYIRLYIVSPTPKYCVVTWGSE